MSEDVVRAKRFEVVDDYGNVRASMGLERDGTVALALHGGSEGTEGQRTVKAVATGRSAALGILDGDGEAVMVFGADRDAGHTVLIRDAGGGERFLVRARQDGSLICEVRDQDGRVRARVETGGPPRTD